MNGRYVEGGIVEGNEVGAAQIPDEPRVLTLVDLGEPVRAPQSLAIAERASGQPAAGAARIDVLPGAARSGLVEVETRETACVAAHAHQRLDLIAHAPVRHPVVVVPVHDDVAAGRLAGEVALGSKREPAGRANQPP